MKIWIDADACPKVIKEIVYRASERLTIQVSVVANRPLAVPRSALISMIRVGDGFDAADQAICLQVEENDLVITADIPLAAEVVAKGAIAIDPRGERYTPESIGERLSVRNFMQDLRAAGLTSGGPAQFSPTDRHRFAAALDSYLARTLKPGTQA